MSRGCGVAEVIDRYTPTGVPAEAASFARQLVAAGSPASLAGAKAWLFAASRLAAYAVSIGLDLRAEVVLSAAVIERFALQMGPQVPASTRRTVRSALRTLSSRLQPGPAPVLLSRDRVKPPYTAAQMDGYLRLADAQPTMARRMRAAGLIALAAGAGLNGADLRAVTGRHIVSRSGGLIVEVTGRRARHVPILAAYHSRLIAVAEFFGDRLVIGGVELSRRNITTPLIASLSGGHDLPRLELGRLRSTWLTSVAELIGLRAFMEAAGVVCSQRLGDIAATLAPVDEPAAVMLLGGRA
jgi:integrase